MMTKITKGQIHGRRHYNSTSVFTISHFAILSLVFESDFKLKFSEFEFAKAYFEQEGERLDNVFKRFKKNHTKIDRVTGYVKYAGGHKNIQTPSKEERELIVPPKIQW
jgi:hypothetical protein